MDYQRFVSYIYYYDNDVKQNCVGFAKVLADSGFFKINISLRGITNSQAEMLEIYAIKDSSELKLLSSCLAKSGNVEFSETFSQSNIKGYGFGLESVIGIVICSNRRMEKCLMSVWKDVSIKPKDLRFDKNDNFDKNVENVKKVNSQPKDSEEKSREEKNSETKNLDAKVEAASVFLKKQGESEKENTDNLEKLFLKADYVDAFDDDYYYDCIEVSPDMLKKVWNRDDSLLTNSFLQHGYYNFHHLLFGRVGENLDNTRYFIGVPGMYCNRERFMASMFGFNNFKRSHRSEYDNNCFGYWYQEI